MEVKEKNIAKYFELFIMNYCSSEVITHYYVIYVIKVVCNNSRAHRDKKALLITIILHYSSNVFPFG